MRVLCMCGLCMCVADTRNTEAGAPTGAAGDGVLAQVAPPHWEEALATPLPPERPMRRGRPRPWRCTAGRAGLHHAEFPL